MGNKLGWVLSGVLLAGLIGYLLFTVVFPTPDGPTSETTRRGVLDVQAPQTPLKDVLGFEPAGAGDAGDDYAAAIEFHNQHQDEFKAMHERLEKDETATLEITDLELARALLKLLAPAAKKETMTYTFVHTPTALRVSAFADGAEDFENLSRVLQCLMEHYNRARQIPESAAPAQAMFLMGWHLMNERARFALTASGMEYQDAAGRALLEVYKDAGDAKKLEAMETYLDELLFAHKLTMDKQRIVWSYDPKPGDVFNIIENDQDRAWRVEGTLTLGALKFRQRGRRGNMRKIEQLLEASQASDEELIRAAGEVARTCTSDQITRWQQ
ncbi:MAG: hypothetical protein JW849_11510 [Phycisphaerae bacterium]|nr:hypothetical protein [Phycisphaerae bacterium]